MALQESHMTQNVTRFLPDPTRNPDIDLAHLGYRLATLAALPSSFPVSRVKLADEGFYFRGQGDEMTCYSCHMRYSGWAQTDNPVEIHRRFSPQCAHVLRKDCEHSAGSAISNGHFTASGSRLDRGSLMNGEREHSTHDALTNGLVTEGTNAERRSVHGSMVNGDRGLSVGNAPSNGHATAAGNTEVNRVGHTPLVNGAPTVFSTPVEDGDGSDPTSRRPASSARATGPSSHRTGASASVTPTSAARGRTTISHSDSRPGTRERNPSILSMSDSSSGENRASILSMSDSSSGENRASILSMSDFSSGENRPTVSDKRRFNN
ncbi:uncharacterized protein [Littorina saxatilis]|uniref:uncharacterized protein n=1 Tax=Littorina saxatilis TaxID=31220 RepID=UPI0038B52371